MHRIKKDGKMVKLHTVQIEYLQWQFRIFLWPIQRRDRSLQMLIRTGKDASSASSSIPSQCVKCSNIDVQSRELQPHCSICMRLATRLLCNLKCIFNAPVALTSGNSGCPWNGGAFTSPMHKFKCFPGQYMETDSAWTLSLRYMNRQTNGKQFFTAPHNASSGLRSISSVCILAEHI